MKTVKEIYNIINKIAPFDTSMDFDNCGILVGDPDCNVDKALISLDITPDVINEAHILGAGLIISHHPVIFKPIKRLIKNDIPYILANKGISAICAHTNLDMSVPGVNTCLAERLGLKNIVPLSIYKSLPYDKIVVFAPETHLKLLINAMSDAGAGKLGNYSCCSFTGGGTGRFLPDSDAMPFIGSLGKYQSVNESRVEMTCEPRFTDKVIKAILNVHPYQEPVFDIFKTYGVKSNIPLGMIGDLQKETPIRDFALHVKNKLLCEGLRYTDSKQTVKKIAVCSGAGGDMAANAYKSGADVLVTGEIKHNMIIESGRLGISIVDAGHFKTEDVVIDYLKDLLSEQCREVEFYRTQVFTDNIKYI